MIVQVELWAFGSAGEIREVTIPDDGTLNDVFHYGQEDFQQRYQRSVSCGDIVRWQDKRMMVMAIGFKEVPQDWKPGASCKDPTIEGLIDFLTGGGAV